MASPIEFETQRLRLRQWQESDREPFAAMNSDPAVMERIGMRNADEDFEHPGVPQGSSLRVHCLYRINGVCWSGNAA